VRMKRIFLLVAIATLCVSCKTEDRLGPMKATSAADATTAMSAREDCLYGEVARLLEPSGSAPASLHNIAVTATDFCRGAVRSRVQRVSNPAVPEDRARDDQIRMEQRAFAIGLELREKRTTKGR
jgi:hypothetical protein